MEIYRGIVDTNKLLPQFNMLSFFFKYIDLYRTLILEYVRFQGYVLS